MSIEGREIAPSSLLLEKDIFRRTELRYIR